MKKTIKLILAISSIFILLVGCSSKNKNMEEKTDDKKIVKTVMGDVEVPTNPENIVVNWYIGDMFTLDLNVVGYNAWEQKSMPFFDKFEGIKKIENWEPEEVMTVNPDLIITYNEEDYEKFSKLAPVLVVREQDMNSVERLRFLGEATGKTKEAEEAIAKFEKKLEESKEMLDTEKFNGKTFSILEDWGPTGEYSGIGYETGSRGGTLIYEYLGLKYPDKLQELIDKTQKTREIISYEVAHEYFGDYILWFLQEGKESAYAKTDIWKSIPAVVNGNVVTIPGEYAGLFFYSDVTSLTAQVDYIANALNSLGE